MQSYDLTLVAEEDLRGIWRYTYETWGFNQAETYFDRIKACCEAVGGRTARSKTLDGLPDGVRIYRCEHHYIVWLDEERPVIIAILHERMDFVRRLPDEYIDGLRSTISIPDPDAHRSTHKKAIAVLEERP